MEMDVESIYRQRKVFFHCIKNIYEMLIYLKFIILKYL